MEQNNVVGYSTGERIAWITLNRPDKRNALNFEMVAALRIAFKKAEDDANVKVIVLKGNGTAFCAGADLDYLKQLQANSFDDNFADSNHLKDLFLQIYRNKKLVIAQVQGHAIAGGCGLATVCDLVFSVPEAKFGYTEVKIGFIPAIVMYFLMRKAGEARAKEMLLSGDLINAETATKYNLVNRVIEAEYMDEFVREYATRICAENSAESMEITKKMIADLPSLPVGDALNFAAKMNAHARSSKDCKRGIAAFLNKEKITW